jgi:hypothetical protein
VAVVTLFIATFAMTPALSLVLRIEPEMEQGIVMLGGDHNHIATVSAVATAGASPGNVFFAPEGKDAVAAIAALHQDIYFIDKQHLRTASLNGKMGTDSLFAERD